MQIIVFVQYVDTGIYGDTAQKYQGGKSSLVEIQIKEIEGKEHTNIGYRDYEDYSQRLAKRVEQDACDEEYYCNDGQQKSVLLVFLLSPGIVGLFYFCCVSHRHFLSYLFQVFFQQALTCTGRTDVVVLQTKLILLVFLNYFLCRLLSQFEITPCIRAWCFCMFFGDNRISWEGKTSIAYYF